MQTLIKIMTIIAQLIGILFWAIVAILFVFIVVIFWGYAILCGPFIFLGDDK